MKNYLFALMACCIGLQSFGQEKPAQKYYPIELRTDSKKFFAKLSAIEKDTTFRGITPGGRNVQLAVSPKGNGNCSAVVQVTEKDGTTMPYADLYYTNNIWNNKDSTNAKQQFEIANTDWAVRIILFPPKK